MWEVSESTVKRWADSGMVNCRKTVGGHRKFDLNSVLEFENRSGLVARAALAERAAEIDSEIEELLARPDFPELARRYRQAATAGKYHCVSELLIRAYLRGFSLAMISEEIIKPALREVGDMWRAGKIRVFEEHLATAATTQALSELHDIVEKKESQDRLALVGCPDGEIHHIAAEVVRYLLEGEGWTVIYLGPFTPIFTFTDAVNIIKPDLVCISATIADDLERTTRDYEHLRRAASKHQTKIVMGGLALNDEQARARFRGAYYASTVYDLMGFLQEWNPSTKS
jgi:MerR family transcriptional regulator, light-induced transcriptional regulator